MGKQQVSKYTKRGQKQRKAKNAVYITIIAVSAALIIACIAIVIVALKNQKIENADDIDTIDIVTTEAPETQQEEPEPDMPHSSEINIDKVEGETEPEFVNPLNGLAMDHDVVNQRPVAIMINNIHVSCPQVGVGNADILYEALAEGGITRLMMLSQDYSALDTVGSIRSSRKYFIDFALNHDAIYVHAGGSEEAYDNILARGIDHLDGVRPDARTWTDLSDRCYFRDKKRMSSMGYEHSLMSSGELITEGISIMEYRTEKKQDYQSPYNIVPWGYELSLNGQDVIYLKMSYKYNDFPEYVYDENQGVYYRYQYMHEEHIDATTGEQLNFKNVLLLVMNHTDTYDEKDHINIDTVGNGTGYYFTKGKMIPITWQRQSQDEPMKVLDPGGNVLWVNRGKTAINIISNEMNQDLIMN